MSTSVNTVVIGAGVVGLAIAARLSQDDSDVLLLEREPTIGAGVSSRNSEVIHAGIYYQTDSLKARLCVSGKAMLYDFCPRHGVPHRRTGKLIVATDEAQTEGLRKLGKQAKINGVDDLVWLEERDIRALEPEVRGCAGLLSPSTGIVDSHALMLALQGVAENRGALHVFNSPVTGGVLRENGEIVLRVGGVEPMELCCRRLVMSAGLGTEPLLRSLTGFPPDRIPAQYPVKGNYFALTGKPPFTHLIYPMPEPGGLGVHATLDLSGMVKFGPDVEPVTEENYSVDPARRKAFAGAIARYWPGVDEHRLRPDYAGIRPRITPVGQPLEDFRILDERSHGIAGLVCLAGIESPGLTSALALAEDVAGRFQ